MIVSIKNQGDFVLEELNKDELPFKKSYIIR